MSHFPKNLHFWKRFWLLMVLCRGMAISCVFAVFAVFAVSYFNCFLFWFLVFGFGFIPPKMRRSSFFQSLLGRLISTLRTLRGYRRRRLSLNSPTSLPFETDFLMLDFPFVKHARKGITQQSSQELAGSPPIPKIPLIFTQLKPRTTIKSTHQTRRCSLDPAKYT